MDKKPRLGSDSLEWIKDTYMRRSHGTPLDPKQLVSSEELLMSQVVQQEALSRLLVEKGIFTKEGFWEMVKMVDREMKRKKKVVA